MKIIHNLENTILENVQNFNIEQTLECGQCFNYDKINEWEYVIIARGKMLHIKQEEDTVYFMNVNKQEDTEFWIEYLDLNRDYFEINTFLLKQKGFLNDAVTKKYGLRILNQEFHESLLGFIISQNKAIPHIRKIVRIISERYGECVGELGGKSYYSFPGVDKLSRITVDEFRECKTGFRAPYLYDAVLHLKNGNLNDKELSTLPIEEARSRLLEIKGVGNKIADCVLLYGLNFREAFPVDVWIKRIMEEVYFKKEVSIEQIQEFAEKKFGQYGGYAQQYLFYYGREMKIGKKTRK
jgi:N-glycosylase/DNA lyase